MRQLNATEVRRLQDGQRVHVKLSRLYEPKPHVEYEGPATLYVQRNAKGEAVTITVREPVVWAEADPRHDLIAPDGALVVEDWCMEVFADAASEDLTAEEPSDASPRDAEEAQNRARYAVVNAALAWAEDKTGGTDRLTGDLYVAVQDFLSAQEAAERAKRGAQHA